MSDEMMKEMNKYIQRTTDNMNKAAKEGIVNNTILLNAIHTDLLALNGTMAFIADRLADLVELQMKEKENKDV